MSKARLEFKVGLFVFIGLALLAGLVLEFSQSSAFLRPHYNIPLRAATVAGLKVHSQVLMSGFPVGTISAINLSPDGTEAIITLQINSKFIIHDDARFVIATSGLLGDQYVAIVRTKNQGQRYPDGKPPVVELPFNYNDLARAVTDFVPRINEAATNLNGAITDIRRDLLTERTLTNLAAALENFHSLTTEAADAVEGINVVVASNSTAITRAVSNLTAFTVQLHDFGEGLKSVVATNSPEINTAIKNIETSSEVLKSLLDDVQAGKGPAGTLIKDEQMAANLADIAYNLSITTSNLNRHGLWGILWKKKASPPPRSHSPAAPPKSTR